MTMARKKGKPKKGASAPVAQQAASPAVAGKAAAPSPDRKSVV